MYIPYKFMDSLGKLLYYGGGVQRISHRPLVVGRCWVPRLSAFWCPLFGRPCLECGQAMVSNMAGNGDGCGPERGANGNSLRGGGQ